MEIRFSFGIARPTKMNTRIYGASVSFLLASMVGELGIYSGLFHSLRDIHVRYTMKNVKNK